MVDHLDDVVDDISVFHRVPYEEVLELPSSRFLRMAARLPLRGGAVTHALAAAEGQGAEVVAAPAAAAPAPAALQYSVPAVTDEDNSGEIAAIAAMSQNRAGFPSIGYAS